jgi:tetratricopeptide (TPR) repeat protein
MDELRARRPIARTLALFALLLIVASGAYTLRDHWITNKPQAAEAQTIKANPTPIPAVAHRTNDNVAAANRPRVDDASRILHPFGPRLARMADAFVTDLGIDLQVVTSSDTSSSIESQADQLFQQRKIGMDAPTGGVLVLLNPQLKLARIEVSYTLEGGLTDLHMGRIARDQLSPYVSYGTAGMAVMDVLHYLRDHAFAAAALGNIELEANLKEAPELRAMQKYASGGAGARTKLHSLPADADFKRTLSPAERAQYAPSSDAKESVEAFLHATADMAGDPTLPLFTDGSQLLRKHYPLAPFEELKRLERIEASKPIEITIKGDYAVASSERPAHGFVPILLHRENGVWRIDLVETWKNLFFDRNGKYFLKNSNTPYAFGLGPFGKGRFYQHLGQLTVEGNSLAKELKTLESKSDALSHLRRGDLWLRNAFIFAPAFSAYEAARNAAPNDPLVLEILADRALYLGFPEIAIPAYEQIGTGVELTIAGAYHDGGDSKSSHDWISRALEENPYDWYALRSRQFLLKNDPSGGYEQDVAAFEMLSNDKESKTYPVTLTFHPPFPVFEPEDTIDVDGTTVFDHSKFGVTIQNTSNRPVEVDSVTLTSLGNARASGLGDIRKYWRFPSGGNRLDPGESAYFNKQWGFTVDTGHQHVRYVFHTCWHGIGTSVKQCQTRWLDTLPAAPRLIN